MHLKSTFYLGNPTLPVHFVPSRLFGVIEAKNNAGDERMKNLKNLSMQKIQVGERETLSLCSVRHFHLHSCETY